CCLLELLFFFSPILGIAEYRQVEYFDGSKVPVCQTRANTFWSALYFLSSVFLFFIVPFVVLVVLYLIIARNLISNAASLVLNKHLDTYSTRARRQVILMLGTVVLSFFLCLIPFRVFTLWIIIVPEERVYALGVERYYNILYFCRIMVYINSAINPILYNLMSSKFRTGFIICSEYGFIWRRASSSSRNNSSSFGTARRATINHQHHQRFFKTGNPPPPSTSHNPNLDVVCDETTLALREKYSKRSPDEESFV
ncbi:PREDICTED: thyrotropin-releasing hormone receptor-like, partial [Nicrophorus vespilloides]|uniref:Thyrotropin-releasing hormone receptor-like n=1 Tax=Nicrophorus vespilloides TaxID=110193 RepID=A0ABM1MZ31_NICVS